MNTIQLTCFLAVAETLNFARAAEQLNITQPAVTHQIRSLETELNTKQAIRRFAADSIPGMSKKHLTIFLST